MPEGPIKLYRTSRGIVAECDGRLCLIANCSWDELITSEDLESRARSAIGDAGNASDVSLREDEILAPIHGQEVWAAGVTYFRSRDARMEESKSAGGGDFYDRVYSANRPELFFKATASRVVGHGQEVAIRRDAKWSVPEPELVLLVSPRGKILGYTIGNDMSSRDIEGENPLYLPQAKVYHRSCALGPAILVSQSPLSRSTEIRLEIIRAGAAVFSGQVTVGAIKREFTSLVEYLYRDNIFPKGCFLFTGTGIVPPDSFTLAPRDEIRIGIDGIGILVNSVAQNS
ncbi:MAG TPA: fumarylacetoacetate hydrolase family protein [Candidatus Acidoferrum sp.]|jgi:2-dehydro-3-deoxy-D-arabinonate dehydratase|nr:fumarylacetoacetate hydrolase family protein [Candidatus Acidoferrum sp.]